MHEVIARYEHMCDGSMQLPCLPAPFYPGGGVVRRGRRTGVRTGGRIGGGRRRGCDGGFHLLLREASFYCQVPQQRASTATATTRTNGSSGVSRDAGEAHATPAYAAAASEQAAGPNREWMEDNLIRDVARSGVRIATCETTSRPWWSTPPWMSWAIRFHSPGLPSSPPSSP